MKQFDKLVKMNRKEVEAILRSSFSLKEFILKLGYKATSGDLYKQIKIFLKKNKYSIKHLKSRKHLVLEREDAFIENSFVSRNTIKRIIIKEKLINYICSECQQLPIWKGKSLSLVLDHKNGINNDNRIENLRFLCPNCNAQQPTFAGSNIKNLKKDEISYSERISIKRNELETRKEEEEIFIKIITNSGKFAPIQISKDEIIYVLKNNFSLAGAAREIGMSDTALKKKCARHKINCKKILEDNNKERDNKLKDKIIKYYLKHKKIKKACRHFNISLAKSKNLLQGYLIPVKKITPEKIKEINKLYQKGWNSNQISKKVGFARATVQWYIKN